MQDIQTVTIVGLGALGILYAKHFSEHGAGVRIVADEERIARYEKDGVYCNGERCDFRYLTPDAPCAPADLLLFTVKATGLTEAIREAASHVDEHTIVLSALNGITSEDIIGKAYGIDNMLYCVAQGMDAVKVGNRLTYSQPGQLCFGEKEDDVVSERMQCVERFFERMQFPHVMDTQMMKRLWGKFMLNVGLNQTVAVYGETYGDVQKPGALRDTMIAAMREVMAVSEKEGHPITEADLNYWLSVLDGLTPTSKPSMRQDVEANRYSEVELFSGTMMKLGRKHGIPTPVNDELYNAIQHMESNYVCACL